jgi:hypothetical protein
MAAGLTGRRCDETFSLYVNSSNGANRTGFCTSGTSMGATPTSLTHDPRNRFDGTACRRYDSLHIGLATDIDRGPVTVEVEAPWEAVLAAYELP